MDSGAEMYQRYLNGDDSGLVELVALYRDGLILFLNSYVKNIDAAEELAEDTFFRLAVRRPRFRQKYSFKTFLYTIGRNLALNYLRKKKAASLDDCADSPDLLRLEEIYIINERKAQVHSAMEKINPDYSRVLWLTYFEGMSNSDAAKIMGKSTRQIENLLYRAKKSLKAELEREGFTYEDI